MTPLLSTQLQDAISDYWDAAYSEGQEQRNHDTIEGRAQKSLTKLNEEIQSYALAYLKKALAIHVEEIWNSDDIMSLNAELDLTMEQLQKIAKAYSNLILSKQK